MHSVAYRILVLLAARWRLYFGPLVTIVVGAAEFGIDRLVMPVPSPGAFLFFPVLFTAYIGGAIPGLVSAAIAVGYGAFLFAEPGTILVFEPTSLARLIVLAVLTTATALVVGTLQTRMRRSTELYRGNSEEMSVLRAALDRIETGVVLLDSDMRARFMNRNFRATWNYPDERADAHPSYAQIMDYVQEAQVFALRGAELDSFIVKRVEMVRAGDPAPIDLRMATGRAIRVQCAVLPDGGRMLIYSDISDLVRQTEQLEKLATTDGLTGLFNRRHFLKLAGAEWCRFRRHGRPVALLILDVDLFKSINDRFGHGVGDQVIAHVAALCRDGRRAADVVARIGGEEFAILLPETEHDAARVVAERLRELVEASPLVTDERNLAVTVSIGVAEARTALGGVDELIKEADRALYMAKRGGRNRVVMATDAPIAADEATLQPAAPAKALARS
jgi:diguanylate cyclase (GGDEF)-like protein